MEQKKPITIKMNKETKKMSAQIKARVLELMSPKYRDSKVIAEEKNGVVTIHRVFNYYSNLTK